MCTVQKPAYIPKKPVYLYISIPVTDGNDESADYVVVPSNGTSNLEATRSKGQGGSACAFLAEVLLVAAILVLLFAGSPCPCSFHHIRNYHSKAGCSLRRAVVEILHFHASPVHEDSPQINDPLQTSVQLRYTPPRPISPGVSSMESPSEEGSVPRKRKRGRSPSYSSKDVRNWVERGEGSDSINVSQERLSSDDDDDSDIVTSMDGHSVTLRTIASEDDDTSNSSHNDEPDITSPMTPRRYIWKK